MGHTASTPQLTPFTSPSSFPVSHKHAVTEDEAHKLLLLEVLYKSIDEKSQQWVDRQTITDWVRMEPYLQQEDTRGEAQRMLNKLSHDEDSSRCTYREFVLAFLAFTTEEARALIVNLLRSASSDRPAQLDALSAGESERAAGYTDLHDEKDSRTLFLLDTVFQAMDTDGQESVSAQQFAHWLQSDPFFEQPEQADIAQHIARVTQRLQAQGSEARLQRHEFLSVFSALPRKHVKLLLIHLLRRTTQHVVKAAKLQRKRSIVQHHRDASSLGSATALDPFALLSAEAIDDSSLQRAAEAGELAEQDDAMSVLPSHHMIRRHSILIGGFKRRSTMDGLRLTLLGQSMIQHDLRETERGQECLLALRSSLYGDVIFSELESAILTQGVQATPTRNTVFHHSADSSVLDCLQLLSMNLLALSNNHAGDLGVEGMFTLIKEMEQRGIVYAGLGSNLAQAAAPRYLDTANGRIALVSFASKVPVGSDATDERPGVNHVQMVDVDSQKLCKSDVRRVLDAISLARDDADVVIAYHHNHFWEKSNVNEESKMGSWKRKLAHKLIDAGANIYVGHGDPRLQGIEIYRGCVIFYCLGSLFFQTKTEVGFYGSEVWESVIVQVHCHRDEEEEDDQVDGAAEMAREVRAGAAASAGDGAEYAPVVSSYSVKLIPIVLNEVGDGFDQAHEHVLMGNLAAEKQRETDAELVARSQPSSPTQQRPPLPVSPLVLPSALESNSHVSAPTPLSPLPARLSASCSQVPAFLSPPPTFSLNGSPQRAASHPPAAEGGASAPGMSYVPPLSCSSPSPHTISSSYALHLSTRGLPRLADRPQAIAILNRIAKMSEEWGTVIEIDEGEEGDEAGGVVGWVSTVREAELMHPFLRPRRKKPMDKKEPPAAAAAALSSVSIPHQPPAAVLVGSE